MQCPEGQQSFGSILPEVRDEIEKNRINTIDQEKSNKLLFFLPILHFMKLSEGMKPQEVLALLSEYQTKMVSAVFEHGGTVDKFIGIA